MSEESSPERIVYFLGAGASSASDFGLPLMKGFFQKDDLFSEEYRQLCEFIVKNFPLVLRKKIYEMSCTECGGKALKERRKPRREISRGIK